MARHVVCERGDLPEGERLLVELEGKDIGVFNVDGEYYAYVNWCLHQAGPCCEGRLSGTIEATFDRSDLSTELEWVRDGEYLCCPWHAWKYDIKSGECLRRPGKLVSYPVRDEGGEIVVETERRSNRE